MDKQKINIDLAVIGAGISGLTSAVYAGRAGLKTMVFEKNLVGGCLNSAPFIENYPGFENISGFELSQKIKNQALKCGAVIEEFDLIKSVFLSDDKKIIETQNKIYNSKAVIIATGTEYKKLPVDDEEKRRGKGIHYCALCDGNMYKNKKVIVVGGGNSALECGIYLSNIAEKVIFILRGNNFRGEKNLVERIKTISNAEIILNSNIISIEGENKVTAVNIKNNKNEIETTISADGIFCCIGSIPLSSEFSSYVKTDEYGYIITDNEMNTNLKNVFAVGDVRKKSFRQLTSAASDGTTAALNVQKNIMMENGGF